MRRLLVPVGVLALALVAGCGGNGGSKNSGSPNDNGAQTRQGGLRVKIDWPEAETRVIPRNTNRVEVMSVPKGTDISNPSAPYDMKYSVVIEANDSAEKTISGIPPGDYLVLARAMPNQNLSGSPSAFGYDPIRIEAGKVSPFSVKMDSTLKTFRLTYRVNGKEPVETWVPVGGLARVTIGVDETIEEFEIRPQNSDRKEITLNVSGNSTFSVQTPWGLGFAFPDASRYANAIGGTFTPIQTAESTTSFLYSDGIGTDKVALNCTLQVNVASLSFPTIDPTGPAVKSVSVSPVASLVKLTTANTIQFGTDAPITPDFGGAIPRKIAAWNVGNQCLVIGENLLSAVNTSNSVQPSNANPASLGNLVDVDAVGPAGGVPSTGYVVRRTASSTAVYRVRRNESTGAPIFETTPYWIYGSSVEARVAAISGNRLYVAYPEGGTWKISSVTDAKVTGTWTLPPLASVDDLDFKNRVFVVRTGNILLQVLPNPYGSSADEVNRMNLPADTTSIDFLPGDPVGTFAIGSPRGAGIRTMNRP
ncbi:MAG: hypothetical protein ACO1SV_02320 [Fimbriimonas sp.]